MMLKAQKMTFAEELKEISNRDRNLLPSRVLVWLFLSFPDLHIDTADDSEIEVCDSSADICA